ncbi:MAG: hypothetical protein JXK93_03965 [Sphaerochaetaceae bacterium]|nr:hypothetical protein [Sphaerochaetaceae bacterium]
MKRTSSILILFIVVLFFSCDGTITSLSSDGATISIDRIPVFSSSSTIVSTSRSIVPESMDVSDFFYTLLAPPITRFEETSESFVLGDSLEVDLFGNSVTLETSLTDEGYIMMSGSVVEEDTNEDEVETGKIEIIYDSANGKFSYYSEVLICNPNEVHVPMEPEMHLYVIHQIPFTDIGTDNSFIADFKTLAYLKAPSHLEFQVIENGELYSGPGDSGGWNLGFAFVSFESLRSSSDPPFDFISEMGIDFNEDWILADVSGTPIADAQFQARRAAMVNAREALFAAQGIRGNPIVGIRTFDDDFSYTTRIYMSRNSTDEIDGITLGVSEEGRLTDEHGELIVFSIDETADPSLSEERIEINQANIDLLKSGLPNADWRARTNLH